MIEHVLVELPVSSKTGISPRNHRKFNSSSNPYTPSPASENVTRVSRLPSPRLRDKHKATRSSFTVPISAHNRSDLSASSSIRLDCLAGCFTSRTLGVLGRPKYFLAARKADSVAEMPTRRHKIGATRRSHLTAASEPPALAGLGISWYSRDFVASATCVVAAGRRPRHPPSSTSVNQSPFELGVGLVPPLYWV
jgi:hypothetical protein